MLPEIFLEGDSLIDASFSFLSFLSSTCLPISSVELPSLSGKFYFPIGRTAIAPKLTKAVRNSEIIGTLLYLISVRSIGVILPSSRSVSL